MKKINITFVATFIVLFIGINFAQAQKIKQQAIKVQPIYGISYERLINNHSSLDVNFLYNAYNTNAVNFQGNFTKANGQIARKSFIGVKPQMRFYVSKKKEGMKGFYVAPYVALGMGKVDAVVENTDLQFTSDVSLKGAVMGVGANAGWQWMIGNAFIVGIQGGLGWQRTAFSGQEVQIDGNSTTVRLNEGTGIQVPNLQFSLGYAF